MRTMSGSARHDGRLEAVFTGLEDAQCGESDGHVRRLRTGHRVLVALQVLEIAIDRGDGW